MKEGSGLPTTPSRDGIRGLKLLWIPCLLAIVLLQWFQNVRLRREIETLRSAQLAYGVDQQPATNLSRMPDAIDADLARLRLEVRQLRGQVALLQTPTEGKSRPSEPSGSDATVPAIIADGAVQEASTPGAPPTVDGGPHPAALVRFRPLPGSNVAIDGTSTIHDWTVKGAIIGGYFEAERTFLDVPSLLGYGTNAIAARAEVRIPVKSLKSQTLVGASKMDEIMQQAMRMEANPTIVYTLERMAVRDVHSASNRPVTLQTQGELVIAGVTNATTLEVIAERLDSRRYKFTGSKVLKMTDFGIQPPAPNLGGTSPIRTGDEVKVRFEWLTGLSPASSL